MKNKINMEFKNKKNIELHDMSYTALEFKNQEMTKQFENNI